MPLELVCCPWRCSASWSKVSAALGYSSELDFK